jgi:hypothetical protein
MTGHGSVPPQPIAAAPAGNSYMNYGFVAVMLEIIR